MRVEHNYPKIKKLKLSLLSFNFFIFVFNKWKYIKRGKPLINQCLYSKLKIIR